MKYNCLSLGLISVVLGGALSAASESSNRATENQMIIRIGPKSFTATLDESATATTFKAMLPLILDMADLNANEKVSRLSSKLPTSESNPGRIQAGDLMIWSSHSVVLFYKSFPTTYSYTKLGRIEDASGLAAAVGSGNVKVTFELKPRKVEATPESTK